MQTSNLAKLAVLAFGVLSFIGGWIIMRGGGFFHSPNRYSADATFVSGPPAVLMAGLQLCAAALAFAWLLRGRLQSIAVPVAFGLVFVPPLLYFILD